MKRSTIILAVAAFASAPAGAVTVSVAASDDASLLGDYSGPSLLSFDAAFNDLSDGYSALSLAVELEDGDVGSPILFNSVFENLTGLATETITVELNGATFSAVGSLFAPFSPGVSGSLVNPSTYLISFGAPGDAFGVELGDVGFGGIDFGIDFGALQAGDTFGITISTGELAQVPAPPVLALFGLAGGVLVARRKRLK